MSNRSTIVLNIKANKDMRKTVMNLRNIAKSLGYAWGKEGSVSSLFAAIAEGEVECKLTDVGKEKQKERFAEKGFSKEKIAFLRTLD
jgi:hypothetical protein